MNIRQLFSAEDRAAIEKYCEARAKPIFLGDWTSLARVLGAIKMYVSTLDQSLVPHLLMDGFWEMWVTQAVVSYVKPGMRCLDIGANFGYYTLLLAELVGSKGSVVGYEPQALCANLLQASISVNGYSWARVRESAVGIPPGTVKEATLHCQKEFFGSASLSPFKGADEWKVVQVCVLDLEFPDGVFDFVKIDVQGLEFEVLDGMRAIIQRSPNIAIALEFTPKEYESPEDTLSLRLASHALTLRTIGTDGVIRPISIEDACRADTGDHRMLWLTRAE